MAIERVPRQRWWPPSPLDGVIWLLLAMLLVPVLDALQGLPWSQRLPEWVVPAAMLCGLGVGVLIVLSTASTRRRWTPLVAAPLLGLTGAAGALLSARGAASPPLPVGTVLLGAVAAALSAAVPWLALRVRQRWLALLLIWATIAGAWGSRLSRLQTFWLVWLLVGTLLLLGLGHLGDEVGIWKARDLQRIGPVLWPSASTATVMSMVAAVLGLAPLGVLQLANLSHWWHQLPFTQGGPLAFDSPQGTPVAVLGAPLGMNSPDVTSNQIVLTYRLVNVPTSPSEMPFVIPPLLGTTFDTFDGTTWTQTGQTTSMPASALSAPANAPRFTAAITVYALPESERATFLIGFDEPLSFSVPAQAAVIESDAPSLVSLTDWEAASSLAVGATYTSISEEPPSTLQPATVTGALSAASLARLTATPPQLTSVLRATARLAGPRGGSSPHGTGAGAAERAPGPHDHRSAGIAIVRCGPGFRVLAEQAGQRAALYHGLRSVRPCAGAATAPR
jgi:hypothetical protein